MPSGRSTLLRQHLQAFLTVSISSVFIFILVQFDRSPPLSYPADRTGVFIEPDPVKPGGSITQHRKFTWHRRCEATVYREVVGSNNIVRAYDAVKTRFPIYLGDQQGANTLVLPNGIPPGPAKLRVLYKFDECGITSRWWPLEVVVPELDFEVSP
jgi:hypothetical protein